MQVVDLRARHVASGEDAEVDAHLDGRTVSGLGGEGDGGEFVHASRSLPPNGPFLTLAGLPAEAADRDDQPREPPRDDDGERAGSAQTCSFSR